MAAPPTATSTPVEVAEFKSVVYFEHVFFLYFFKQLSLTCNVLSKFYLNWPICKDLLLIIEHLKEQLTGLQSALGQCHTEMALAGIRAGPLFWVLVIMVVGAVFLGGVRIAWHARRDGFFIVDR